MIRRIGRFWKEELRTWIVVFYGVMFVLGYALSFFIPDMIREWHGRWYVFMGIWVVFFCALIICRTAQEKPKVEEAEKQFEREERGGEA